MPRIVFATIYREWSQYYDFQPNVEFGRYITNPILITSNDPSTIRDVLKVHHPLCMQACDLVAKASNEVDDICNTISGPYRIISL